MGHGHGFLVFMHYVLVSCHPMVTSAEVAEVGHGLVFLVCMHFVLVSCDRWHVCRGGLGGPQTWLSDLCEFLVSGDVRRGGLGGPQEWLSCLHAFVLVSCDPLLMSTVVA